MYRIQRAEIWGGIRDRDQDVCSAGIVVSLYSGACAGGAGGDIYYVSVCGHDQLTRVAVADVAGHGPSVTAVSEWLYAALESRMGDVAGDALLAELNQLAVDRGIEALTTIALLAFYTNDGRLYYVYAGHSPALVHRRGVPGWQSVTLDRESHENAPLGVLDGASFDQECRPLASGDRLFVYTDGLVEAPGRSGEQFGEERVLDVLAANDESPLPQLKGAVLDAVRSHAGPVLSHDDVTLVAVEIR